MLDSEVTLDDSVDPIDGALPDMMWDAARPLPIDAAIPLSDAEWSPEVDQGVADRGQVTTLDPVQRDAMTQAEMDRGAALPPNIDPDEVYDPAVFQRARPESGCQAASSHSNSPLYLLFLLFIWYAYSHLPPITRKRL